MTKTPMSFDACSKAYAALCIERRNLYRAMPICEFYAQWSADIHNGDVPRSEIEEPCEMQSYRTGIDMFEPLPIGDRCENCKRRAELKPQIAAITASMRGMKLRMLRAYERELALPP